MPDAPGSTIVIQGNTGLSAYQIAQQHGFSGTEQQWLDSIKGATGVGTTFVNRGDWLMGNTYNPNDYVFDSSSVWLVKSTLSFISTVAPGSDPTNWSEFVVGGAPFMSTSWQLITQHSITGGGDGSADRTINLVGDTAAPGNNKFYGTDGAGSRGWYAIGAGSGDTISDETVSVDSQLTIFAGTTGKHIKKSTSSGRPLLTSGVLSVAAIDLSSADATGILAAARFPALTGDVTTSSGSVSTTIGNDAVTFAKFQNISTDNILGRKTASSGDVEELTALPWAFTGDVTTVADSNATTIANDAVTYAKMQNVSAASKLLGRGDSGSGDTQEITLGTNLSMSGTTLNASGGGGGGTVTHTGGALTSNSVVLGAGSDDVKVVAGIITDGTSKLTLGVAGSSVGSVDFKNATSGTLTVAPPTGALGTITTTLPNASSTLPIFSQQATFTGLSAARTITLPDANITVARTDAGNTFTGVSTTTSWAETTPVITGGLTASGSGANNFGGSTGSFTTSTGTNTISGSTVNISTLANNGTIAFSNSTRSTGTNAYFRIDMPTDTGITASTEGRGVRLEAASRTWASTGTVALQREVFLSGPTYASASASQTFTDVFTLYVAPPIAGTNAIFTRGHTLGIVDATSASSSITGGLIVATTLGTTATSVGIGGGNINAGGTITSGSTINATGYNVSGSAFNFTNLAGDLALTQTPSLAADSLIGRGNGGGAGDWQAITLGTNLSLSGTTLNTSGAAVANPGSQLLGLTVINGSAATAMRSDGAPALSQAIVPTWTGQHTFSIARTVASGASAVLDDVYFKAATTTITGGTNITTATGFNKWTFERPTYTDATPVTISHAATMYIADSPLAAGSVGITNPYSLWIDAGRVRIDSSIAVGTGGADPGNGRIDVQSGYLVAGAAATGNVLRGDGSVFTSAQLSTTDLTDIATDSILGRATASTGDIEVLTALPFAFTGDVTRPADSNAQTIANDAVTYAKMQNVSANSKLLGRGDSGAPADPQEITIGSGLSMTGTTLSATAGGGGTVTNTGGALTSNAVVIGAGSNDVKVVAGVITDGTSKLTLGVAGTSVGSIDLKNATSGTITILPTTGALGTVSMTIPAANSNPVQPDSGTANNFLTGINSAGVIAKAQPDFTNLSGDFALTQTPSLSADKLVGRGNGGGAGDWQSITLGTNLSMSGTTLNATGGSASITVNSSTITSGTAGRVVYETSGNLFGEISNATSDGTTMTLTSPKIVTDIKDTNGNTIIGLTATGSADDYIRITNHTSAPVISADGSDTNIALTLTPKGTGALTSLTDNVHLGRFTGAFYRMGLDINDVTGVAALGDTTHSSNGQGLVINNNNKYSVLGDWDDQVNGIMLVLDDGNNEIAVLGDAKNWVPGAGYDQPAKQGMQVYVDNSFALIKTGDVTGKFEGTMTDLYSPAPGNDQRYISSSFWERHSTVAPVAATGSAGTNLLTAGTYYWVVTFVTPFGETIASQTSNSVVVNPATQLPPDLTSIPLGSWQCVARKVYRTAADAGTFKYVATINDNTTTTYTDNLPDASLGAVAYIQANQPGPDPVLTLTSEFRWGRPVAHKLTTGNNTGAATSYTTASITPKRDRLVLLSVSNKKSSGTADTPTVTGNGMTWTNVSSLTVSGDTQTRLTLFRAFLSEPAPSQGTVTIDFGGVSQASCAWSIVEYECASGTSPIVQTVTNTAASTTSLTLTPAALTSPFNVTYAAFAVNDSQTLKVNGRFTKLDTQAVTSNSLLTAWNCQALLPLVATGTSTSWAGITVEIKSSFAEAGAFSDLDGDFALTQTPSLAADKIIGRGNGGGAGDWQAITLGTNLSMTGTTLNASGGGGSPGGTDSQVQYNNGGAFGGTTLTYDDVSGNMTWAGGALFVDDLHVSRGGSSVLIDSASLSSDRVCTVPDADSCFVVPDAGAANNFLTSISASGAIAKSQPAFSNLSGDFALTQTPSLSADKLMGRGNGGGAGDWEAITLGTNLSMSGTTLNATGGGGSQTPWTSNIDADSFNLLFDDSTGIKSSESTNPELLLFTSVASAVNELTITNAATGAGPEISVTGGDTNIDLKLTAKGTGNIVVAGSSIITTGGTELTLRQTGATFGTTALKLQNGVGTNGATFENNGLDLIDFILKPSTGPAANIRLEHRSGSMFSSANNTHGELQFAFNTAGVFAHVWGHSKSVVCGTLLLGATSSDAATITADVGLTRGASGRLDVVNISGTIKDFKADHINAVTGYTINGAAGSNKVLKGNGTDFVASTETYAAPSTSGNLMQSDGTNWTSSATISTLTLAENASIKLDEALTDGNYTGITIPGVSGYTQAFGDLVYLDPTDSRWEMTDANSAAAADGDARGILGMVVSTATDGNACLILLQGTIRANSNFPTFTVGAPIYVSETAGDVTNTQPVTGDAVIRVVGYGLANTDTMYFAPAATWITHT